jgi:type II secretory pathway component PulC
MKLPQHPALPLLSVALLAYLCGDVACAVMERQFANRPQRQQAGGGAPLAPPGPSNPGELLAVLNGNAKGGGALSPDATPTPNGPTGPGQTPGVAVTNSTVALPTLVGTLEGQGQALAVLQAQGSSDTAVVALGEDFQGFKVMEVGAFQARLRDARNQEYTISMSVANNTTAPPPVPAPVNNTFQPVPPPDMGARGPYKTTKELRADIDNKGQWINNILVKPVLRDGEAIGVQINYKGGENPFSRLGIQSGDTVLSLNNKPAKAVENLPEILMELRNSQSLNFNLERNGQPTPLTVNLEQ